MSLIGKNVYFSTSFLIVHEEWDWIESVVVVSMFSLMGQNQRIFLRGIRFSFKAFPDVYLMQLTDSDHLLQSF